MLYIENPSAENQKKIDLNPLERLSVSYHDVFDYPLTSFELIRWTPGNILKNYSPFTKKINYKNGFYFINGREGITYKRVLRKRISERKMEVANRAAWILSFIPTIKMVAVTGSLSMENSIDDSDIDFLIITSKNTLWTTRFLSYLLLKAFKQKVRKAGQADEADKLCLNMWLDESDFLWKKERNLYTAHEISQIKPLINKQKTYEKFIWGNRWILNWWPNSLKIQSQKNKGNFEKEKLSVRLIRLFNSVSFKFQLSYMKSKITREKISLTRAIFHPNDWGKVVLGKLSS